MSFSILSSAFFRSPSVVSVFPSFLSIALLGIEDKVVEVFLAMVHYWQLACIINLKSLGIIHEVIDIPAHEL